MINITRRNRRTGKIHDVLDRTHVLTTEVATNTEYVMINVNTLRDHVQLAIRGTDITTLINQLTVARDEFYGQFSSPADTVPDAPLPDAPLPEALVAEVLRIYTNESTMAAIRHIRTSTGLGLIPARRMYDRILHEHYIRLDPAHAGLFGSFSVIHPMHRSYAINEVKRTLTQFGVEAAELWLAQYADIATLEARALVHLVEVSIAAQGGN